MRYFGMRSLKDWSLQQSREISIDVNEALWEQQGRQRRTKRARIDHAKPEGQTLRKLREGHEGQMVMWWESAENGKWVGLISMKDCEGKIEEKWTPNVWVFLMHSQKYKKLSRRAGHGGWKESVYRKGRLGMMLCYDFDGKIAVKGGPHIRRFMTQSLTNKTPRRWPAGHEGSMARVMGVWRKKRVIRIHVCLIVRTKVQINGDQTRGSWWCKSWMPFAERLGSKKRRSKRV